MDAHRILTELDVHLKEALQKGLGKRGLAFPLDPNAVCDDALKEICQRLTTVFEMISEAYRFSERLAQGDLSASVSRTNIFAMPLKGLQASLAHLTWQAHQVAKGDLNQRVHFLGEFSESFNHMIGAIREKSILEQQFKLITDVIGEGIFLVDCSGKILFSNPEASRLLGYHTDELDGILLQEVIYKQKLDGTLYQPGENPLYHAVHSGNNFEQEGSFTCKSGFIMPVNIVCRPTIKDTAIEGAVIAFRDISEQKKYLQSLETINKLLEKQATTDPLTGIFNRIKFDQCLMAEIARVGRYNSSLAFIIFDIDHFKNVNDLYGHSAGDDVLKRLAKLVETNIRETDIFARWGGEEFVIQAPGIALADAVMFAEKLRVAIEQYDFNQPKKITASFGVTVYKKGDNSSRLINRADKALYLAKENGRNQVRCIE